ncbi:hypothetical protein EXIGLDRAFT_845010 [Exidia glandulosa HHB12029]|uniref:Uncharacterized protein n=1 Tax=Exidia glandulosa HHB12029 TaxID=1314781 RepID=A0A165BQ55_EXIGL|nr:hypothetical protein EXIGLDRAFT_845010 [Exidia glandulosa HHB12029]
MSASTPSVDADGIPVIVHPSMDIEEDLKDVLTSDLEFRGTFAWFNVYADAPNPGLHVDGLGVVGLPLGDYVAGGFKAVCGDPVAPNVWEVDAARVRCDNEAWATWIESLHNTVCWELALGPAGAATHVECSKLVLYGAGAKPMDALKSRGSPDRVASLLAVLPSRFSAGGVTATFQDRAIGINASQKSALSTTAVAVYADVELQTYDIVSGYCFALLYELVQPPDSGFPRICPPTEPAALTELRHVLLSWKQQEDDIYPDKIVWMLDDHYYDRNASGYQMVPAPALLRGNDAAILRALDCVAKEIGVCLGLTQLCHTVKGAIKGSGYDGRFTLGVDDDENLEMASDGEYEDGRRTRFFELVDLDGKTIRKNVKWDERDHAVLPWSCEDVFEPGDGQESGCEVLDCHYEDMEYSYDRTAIVIWPNTSSFHKKNERRGAL